MVEKGLPTPQRPSFVAQKSPPCALRCARSTRASFPATLLCLLSIRLSLAVPASDRTSLGDVIRDELTGIKAA